MACPTCGAPDVLEGTVCRACAGRQAGGVSGPAFELPASLQAAPAFEVPARGPANAAPSRGNSATTPRVEPLSWPVIGGLVTLALAALFGRQVVRAAADWLPGRPRPVVPIVVPSGNTPANGPDNSTLTSSEDAARRDIERLYQDRDAAYDREDLEGFFRPCSVFYETITTAGEAVSLDVIRMAYARTFTEQVGVTSRTEIQSFSLQGTDAVANVKTVLTTPGSFTSQTMENTYEDTWNSVVGVWRLRQRRVLSIGSAAPVPSSNAPSGNNPWENWRPTP